MLLVIAKICLMTLHNWYYKINRPIILNIYLYLINMRMLNTTEVGNSIQFYINKI